VGEEGKADIARSEEVTAGYLVRGVAVGASAGVGDGYRDLLLDGG
jgi:hypothetical protein